MENKQVIVQDGFFTCDLDITVNEWIDILEDKSITTNNYKTWLLRYYLEPNHKATCAFMAKKYSVDAQAANSSMVNFGKAVKKALNRFNLIGTDGKETYWIIPMGKGRDIKENGKTFFEWTLRTELVEAIERLGWNERFTWIPFYEEMAEKLLKYKDDRTELVKIVFGLDRKFVVFFHDDNENDYSDLDPFSVFAIFNRQIKDESRIEICNYFKEKLSIEAPLPKDFDSIPIVNNQNSVFVWRYSIETDTQPLWTIFEDAIRKDFDKEDFGRNFDIVQKQQGIKWNLTMGLYWVKPQQFMPLDKNSRVYLNELGIEVFKENDITGTNYLRLLKTIQNKIDNNEIREKSFPEISYNAWLKAQKSENENSAILKLINLYKKIVKSENGLKGLDELYKWELVTRFQGKPTIDAPDFTKEIQQIKFENLIYQGAIGTIAQIAKSEPEQYRAAFKYLFDESISLQNRISEFILQIKTLYQNMGEQLQSHHDERTASVFLTYHNPQEYAIYKNDIYQYLCTILHKEPQKTAYKYTHYLELLNNYMLPLVSDDKELQQMTNEETSEYIHSNLLLAQTILWVCKKEDVKYWLVGYSFGATNSQLDKFLKEGKWIGGFDKQNDNAQIQLAEKISENDILILKSTSTKGQNHSEPFLRIKAIGIVKSVKTKEYTNEEGHEKIDFHCEVDYFNKDERDFDGNEFGAFRKTIHELKNQDIMEYIKEMIDNKTVQEESAYSKYITLLKANKNLIFTGAPGTGKTYLAKQIAAQMILGKPYSKELENDDTFSNCYKFVQFHPSYDYTDFVEGLRPTPPDENRNIGFERKDGVFKEFCKKALQNYVDSQKSEKDLQKTQSLQNNIGNFLSEAIEKGTEFKTKTGSVFYIKEASKTQITIAIPENKVAAEIKASMTELFDLLAKNVPLENVKDIKDYYGRQFNTQQDSYIFVLCNEISKQKDKVTLEKVQPVPQKDFVFIIDEINRGEISKIFGELFFSIDPSYRGTDGRVDTQYQNLIEDGDAFYNGFFVPENVYIIGTMNDIDRSVESMDFAMRRRFTFMEISADESAENMGLSDEIKARMTRLNGAISNIEGLNSSYYIGGAYFMKLKTGKETADELWQYHIKTLLFEYLRGTAEVEKRLTELKTAYDGTANHKTEETELESEHDE